MNGIPQVAVKAALAGATLWIGVACLANALRCGRVHCAVMGGLYPALGLLGMAGSLGAFTLDWNYYLSALWAVPVAGFSIECVWKNYVGTSQVNPRRGRGC